MSEFKEKIRNIEPKTLFIILFVALITVLFFLHSFFIRALLVILVVVSAHFVKRFKIKKIGLELVCFTAVLIGAEYGPILGGIIGAVLVSIHFLVSGSIGVYCLWNIPIYGLVGFIAGIYVPTSDNILSFGIAMTLMINGNNIFFTLLKSPNFIFSYLPFSITNIIINIGLFYFLGI